MVIHGLSIDFFKESVLSKYMMWLMTGQFLILKEDGYCIVTLVGLAQAMVIITVRLSIPMMVLLLLARIIIGMDLMFFTMSKPMIFNVLDMLY